MNFKKIKDRIIYHVYSKTLTLKLTIKANTPNF